MAVNNKGTIIFYDDDSDFTDQFKQLMDDSGFDIEVFNDISLLRSALVDSDVMKKTKCLVFDLAKNKDEASQTRDFEILTDIKEKFNELRIPIFIHSTYADQVDLFKDCGTVWKIVKDGNSVEKVVATINKLDLAGFIEVFSPLGTIENKLMQELHDSFTKQFREGEIEKILDSIGEKDPNYRERSMEIFKRVAIRSLFAEILAPLISTGGKVNPIEHYHRRRSLIEFWTGDILVNNIDASELLLVITPRCNVASKAHDELLVCKVIKDNFPDKTSTRAERDTIKYAVNDKPEVSGYNRYLPPSPIFEGGQVVLSSYSMRQKTDLKKDFHILMSLSDELTNEILGKFGAYFFRTGITPYSDIEVVNHINVNQ